MKLSGKLAETGLKPFAKEEFRIGGHKMPKIWIMVADSQKAYFFRKPNHCLEKIGEALPEGMPESEITNQTAGRMSNPFGGGGRHRFEVHDEALKHESHEFLRALAAFLDQAASEGAFDRLVLALAPKMLGMLRPLLSREVNIRITAELDKDLTHLNEKKLFEYLDKALWV